MYNNILRMKIDAPSAAFNTQAEKKHNSVYKSMEVRSSSVNLKTVSTTALVEAEFMLMKKTAKPTISPNISVISASGNFTTNTSSLVIKTMVVKNTKRLTFVKYVPNSSIHGNDVGVTNKV